MAQAVRYTSAYIAAGNPVGQGRLSWRVRRSDGRVSPAVDMAMYTVAEEVVAIMCSTKRGHAGRCWFLVQSVVLACAAHTPRLFVNLRCMHLAVEILGTRGTAHTPCSTGPRSDAELHGATQPQHDGGDGCFLT